MTELIARLQEIVSSNSDLYPEERETISEAISILNQPYGHPTIPGFYRIRLKDDHAIFSVWGVTQNDIDNPPLWFTRNDFSGPISMEVS